MTRAAAVTTSRPDSTTTRPHRSARVLGRAAAGLVSAAALVASGLGPSAAPAQAATTTMLSIVQSQDSIVGTNGSYQWPIGLVADPAGGVDIAYGLDVPDEMAYPTVVRSVPGTWDTGLASLSGKVEADPSPPYSWYIRAQLARDGQGNLYIASGLDHVTRVSPSGAKSDITITDAPPNQSITEVAVNPQGTMLFVADSDRNEVAWGTINADNTVTLHPVLNALCTAPSGMMLDAASNLYVACADRIVRVSDAVAATIYAVQPQSNLPVSGLGTHYKDVAVDPYGDVFISDPDSQRIVEYGADHIQRTLPITVYSMWGPIAFGGSNTLYISQQPQVTKVTLSAASSTTQVTCTPNPPVYPGSTTCTATVTVSAGLGKPTGTVSWGTGGFGKLSARSCNLSATSDTSARCSVKYTTAAMDVGRSVSIAADYSGDVHYRPSHGKAIATVTKAA